MQVQFCVGTPPGITGRRRSTSGSSCGTSSPPCTTVPWPIMNSPLRRAAGSAGVISHFPGVAAAPGPLAPIKGSPTKLVSVLANVSEMAATPSGGGMVQWRNAGGGAAAADWNHPAQRAMTLPEFGST